MKTNNRITKAHWDQASDAYYQVNNTDSVLKRIIETPACAFQKKTFEMLQERFPDLKGKKICVPSSGDNTAVFAFHLMGAQVTSVDISPEQIKNARLIADRHGWDIEFKCGDSMDLYEIKNNEYDFVYTSNGVHVWISDLRVMYGEFNRILKDDGFYILFETHPFIRPFDDSKDIINVRKVYEDIGPFDDVPQYHWRMQDFINHLISAKFNIERLEEFHPEVGDLVSHMWWYKQEIEAETDKNKKFDWKQNPWAALPQWLSICAKKASSWVDSRYSK